jgi:ubiquinone/menaquinone biosynthesis C-methylase UbiE
MANQHAAFIGSIPENYDRYLGPALCEPYASDMAERVQVAEGASVLELACGTGIVTCRLRDRLPSSVRLVATDLNEAMMAYAAQKFRPEEAIEWKQADAANLPFDDESFDAVVCQFGLMFVPDKAKAVREAYRVLKSGGTFFFSVWDAIEYNDLARIANTTIAALFEDNPPDFYEVPFSLHDPDVIASLLTAAGFKDPQVSLLALPSISPSATQAATGLIEGNPVRGAIEERDPAAVPAVIKAVAAAVASGCGDNPVQGKMRAFVCTAVR